MAQQPPIAQENLQKSQSSEPRTFASASESRKLSHPQSSPTVSAMWVMSVLWAAEGLADPVFATLHSVARSHSITAGSQRANNQRRPGR